MRRRKQLRTYDVALLHAGLGPVAGVDEAGRGSCCGPITIAAVILPERIIPDLADLNDSKALSPATRERLAPVIRACAVAWSVVHISAQDIDARGIQWANLSGMRRAVAQLDVRPGYILTDALVVPGFSSPHLPIIGGDSSSLSIAAASVLAKVSRDAVMNDLDHQYSGYGLATHKGYGTKDHLSAVRRLGATPQHRYSYKNIRAAHNEWLTSYGAASG